MKCKNNEIMRIEIERKMALKMKTNDNDDGNNDDQMAIGTYNNM